MDAPPILLPVRVELQVGVHQGGPACSLTLSDISFVFRPVSGDFVILAKDTEEPFVLSIKAVAHYTEPTSVMVLTKPIHCESYDEMLETLDWFKARYQIEDFQSAEAPEPYYVLYRTVVHLLGIKDDVPIVRYDPDLVKVLAETCRTIWIANMYSRSGETNGKLPLRSDILEKLPDTNGQIETLHRIVFGNRQQKPNGPELRHVLKEWDESVNANRNLNWDVDDDFCQFVGKIVFSRLKCEKPDFLRTES